MIDLWIRRCHLFLILWVITGSLGAVERSVPEVVDFQQLAQQAQQRNLPILVFFSAKHCEYCEQLEADHLGFMVNSEEYDNKMILRKLMIDGYARIVDFSGEAVLPEDFVYRYNVDVTPTLLFFDAQGNPLAKKIIGYNRGSFFGYTLDERINEVARR